jgi:acyl-CoA dehydrogenase
VDSNELLDPFARLVGSIATPAAIRAIEDGAPADEMWDEFENSGFLDALVSEAVGGVGLSLSDIYPLIAEIGASAVPLPVAETMAARALLAQAGIAPPSGPIALATAAATGTMVPCGLVAAHILVDTGEALVLAAAEALAPAAPGVPYSLAARITIPAMLPGPSLPRPADGLRPLAAVLRATLISGALARVVDMTTAYANERVQFGKPIGRQQAVQQNLAVMAQDMVAARIAAQLACATGLGADVPVAAMAKSIASAAAGRVATGAHAVHGAIGMSEEYDLQLLTRRLYEWRMADGSARYWNSLLGHARLADPASTVDWTRREIFREGRLADRPAQSELACADAG